MVTAVNPLTGLAVTLPPADVFNLVPKDGEPARFGLSILGNDVYLEAGIAWEGDYHEYFTIDVAKFNCLLSRDLGLGDLARILKNRLVFDGRAGDGTFITTPSTCYDPNTAPFQHVYSTYLRADSYETPDPSFPDGSSFFESPIPPGQMPVGCDQVTLDGSSIGADPGTTQTDSPSGASVNVDVPFVTGGGNVAKSNLKDATVTLPPGMGLNPGRRRRPRGLHRRPVRQGDPQPGRLSGRFENRHGLDPDAAAAPRLAGRQRLPRATAEQRPRLRPGVQDLRRCRVEPLCDLGSPGRQRQRRSPDRSTHHHVLRQPSGPVQLLPAPLRWRAEGAADQSADLRAPYRRRAS